MLAPGGRFVLGDGTADRALARIADRLLRRVDRSHVRLYRSEELVDAMRTAGFEEIGVRSLWDGGYAIVSARRSAAPTD